MSEPKAIGRIEILVFPGGSTPISMRVDGIPPILALGALQLAQAHLSAPAVLAQIDAGKLLAQASREILPAATMPDPLLLSKIRGQ